MLFSRLLSKISVLVLDIIMYELRIICRIINDNVWATIETKNVVPTRCVNPALRYGSGSLRTKELFFDYIACAVETCIGIGEINCHNADVGIF